MIMIAINILIGVAGSIYSNSTEATIKGLNLSNNYMDENKQGFTSEEKLFGGVKSSQDTDQKTIGSGVGWGTVIIDIIKIGFNPFAIRPSKYDTLLEKVVAGTILFLKNIIYVLLIIEVIMFLKNRKTS